jgi:hypothetical protein
VRNNVGGPNKRYGWSYSKGNNSYFMLDVINNNRGPNMGVWVDLNFNTNKYMNVNELTYGND